MEAVKVENLTFAYPEADENALKEISFTIQSGEFITLCGSSGCGKTTLLRHLKPALAPHGVKSGEIYFQNRNITELSHEEQSKKI
ncbi:MAG TPA: cobalt ABC transporter ATP-binding protein, partial [Ruminococcus sp.]|nr:cobalt ABC transporter ATP-binding protein [Ruminococcus sp.]